MNILTKDRRDELFQRLDALLQDYPEISRQMALEYEEDPTHEMWSCCEGDHEPFDPTEPSILESVVVITTYRTLTGWRAWRTLVPTEQSPATTLGMLVHARDTW